MNPSSTGGAPGTMTLNDYRIRGFVPESIAWAHFDTVAWRPAAKPGRPKGGDALGLRAAWAMLKQRYGG